MDQATHIRTVADIPIYEYSSTTSTQDEARNWLEVNSRHSHDTPLYAVHRADIQTLGRGRRDRAWLSGVQTSLLSTFIVRNDHGVPMLEVARIVMSFIEVLNRHGADVSVKWPNDFVVIDDGIKKIGGCLTEIVDTSLLVGIGINISESSYEGVDAQPATSLEGLNVSLTAQDLLDETISQYVDVQARMSSEEMWSNYQAKCSTLGESIRVDTLTGPINGIAHSITSAGALVIESGGAIREVHEGDVVHLRVAK